MTEKDKIRYQKEIEDYSPPSNDDDSGKGKKKAKAKSKTAKKVDKAAAEEADHEFAKKLAEEEVEKAQQEEYEREHGEDREKHGGANERNSDDEGHDMSHLIPIETRMKNEAFRKEFFKDNAVPQDLHVLGHEMYKLKNDVNEHVTKEAKDRGVLYSMVEEEFKNGSSELNQKYTKTNNHCSAALGNHAIKTAEVYIAKLCTILAIDNEHDVVLQKKKNADLSLDSVADQMTKLNKEVSKLSEEVCELNKEVSELKTREPDFDILNEFDPNVVFEDTGKK